MISVCNLFYSFDVILFGFAAVMIPKLSSSLSQHQAAMVPFVFMPPRAPYLDQRKTATLLTEAIK